MTNLGFVPAATKHLLIDFRLNDAGHLELEGFGEDLDEEILENAYPLIARARRNSLDADDFPEAAKAERERLYPKDEIRETTSLARNLFIARIASDQNTTLATAIKKIKVNNLTFSEPWHTLAARSATLNTVHFANHMTSMMDASAEDDDADKSLRMSSVPDEELKPYEKADLLPHYLLTAVIAVRARGSMLMVWPHVREHVKEEIGTFWYWLAQEVRALSVSA